MKIFKRCMMCNKILWRKYDTFKMDTAEGVHKVYLCTPQCWENEYEDDEEDEISETGFDSLEDH